MKIFRRRTSTQLAWAVLQNLRCCAKASRGGVLCLSLLLSACASTEAASTEAVKENQGAEAPAPEQEDSAVPSPVEQIEESEAARVPAEDQNNIQEQKTESTPVAESAAQRPAPSSAAAQNIPQEEPEPTPVAESAAQRPAPSSAAAQNIPQEEPEPPPVVATVSPTPANNDCNPTDLQQCLVDLSQAAQQAVNAAIAAGAAVFSSDLLEKAEQSLAEAQAASPEDSQAKRQLLVAAAQQAQEAQQAATRVSAQELLDVVAELASQLADYMEKQLDDLNAALFMPEDNARARIELAALRSEPDPALSAQGKAEQQRKAAHNAKAVIDALVQNLAWLDELEREVEKLKWQTEQSRLRSAAAQEKAAGDESYNAARRLRQDGQMPETETQLFQAQEAYRNALQGVLSIDQVDRRLRLLQQGLEDSGEYNSIANDGQEYEAPQWKGKAFLAENPLVDLETEGQSLAGADSLAIKSRLITPRYIEEGTPKTEGVQTEDNAKAAAASQNQQAGQEEAGSDLVALPQTPTDIYYRSVDAWKQAVQRRNDGNLAGAMEKLKESANWLEEYRSLYAVMRYYVVRENIDSLWVISGYESIYNDPFQWRRIYNRNTAVIEEPHLIYPNQRLLIPLPRLP